MSYEISSHRVATFALAIALGAGSCLNRSNVPREDAGRLDPSDGIAFGRFDVAAPASVDEDIPLRGGDLDTEAGALVKVESAEGGSPYRFRLPPNGEFRLALPEGDYRIVHWKGILRDGPFLVIEAHLDLEVAFTVQRGAATAAGRIRFDGTSLAIGPAEAGEIALFREDLPAFPGAVLERPARAISVSPPVKILRYSNPGVGGGDGSSRL